MSNLKKDIEDLVKKEQLAHCCAGMGCETASRLYADQIINLIEKAEQEARIDEWQTILNAKITYSGTPALFNPEGLSITTSNTKEMTTLLHGYAKDRIKDIKSKLIGEE